LLSRQPMYGYQIIKELGQRSGGYFHFKEGTLYPALHRLEEAGLVVAKWQQLPSGQERRYYYITEKGLEVWHAKLGEWQGFSKAMNLVINPEEV
jgi:PadR family transcriptional regulator PadR